MVALVESPKFHAYEVIVPYATVEADASNEEGEPGGPVVTVNDATGAWSGTMARLKRLAVASTVGKNEEAVRRYIQDQEKEDQRLDQMEMELRPL